MFDKLLKEGKELADKAADKVKDVADGDVVKNVTEGAKDLAEKATDAAKHLGDNKIVKDIAEGGRKSIRYSKRYSRWRYRKKCKRWSKRFGG